MLALLVAGCGGSDDDDEARADPTTASGTASARADVPPSRLLDPCTVMTDAELREFGQDPVSRHPDASVIANLTGCTWSGKIVGMLLNIGPESFESFRSRGGDIQGQFPIFEQIEIDGRPAMQYSVEPSTTEHCAVRIAAGSGTVGAEVSDSSGLDAPQDLCPVAREAIKVIAAKLPPQGE